MPYPINKSDGTLLLNLQDQTRDNTTTSVTLLGRAVVDYGENIAENFVHVLENFAASTPPENPLEGQLWYHSFDPGPPPKIINKVKVWDGLKWNPVGGASTDPERPTNPQPGDLWYNQETKAIYFWNGTKWIKVGTPNTGSGPGGPDDDDDGDGIPNKDDPDWDPNNPNNPSQPPPDPTEGELWWMLPERQLWAFDETATTCLPPDSKRINGTAVPVGWVLVGPLAPKQSDTYTSHTTIVNNNTQPPQTANVIKVVVNGQLVAMWSDRAITMPAAEVDGMPFTTYNPADPNGNLELRPGLNMNNELDTFLNGIAVNSDLLDGLDSSQFLRRDVSDAPTQNGLIELGDPDHRWQRFYSNEVYGAGNSPGVDAVVDISFFGKATAAEEAEKAKRLTNPFKLIALATGDVEGEWTNIDGHANPSGDRSTELKISEAGLETIRELAEEVVEEALAGDDGQPRFISAQESTPILGPNIEVGSVNYRLKTVFAETFDGISTKARYADVAERYAADAVYAPGTVVRIGGAHEITQTSKLADDGVFGVISTDPAYLMNSEAGDNLTHPPVALVGRVPVRVVGPVAKGDRLVSGPIPGTAIAKPELSVDPLAVIGRSLVDKTTAGEELILCVVSIK